MYSDEKKVELCGAEARPNVGDWFSYLIFCQFFTMSWKIFFEDWSYKDFNMQDTLNVTVCNHFDHLYLLSVHKIPNAGLALIF